MYEILQEIHKNIVNYKIAIEYEFHKSIISLLNIEEITTSRKMIPGINTKNRVFEYVKTCNYNDYR